MASIFQRIKGRLRAFRNRARPLPTRQRYIDAVAGKAGLEIGGPSPIFRAGNLLPLYDSLGALDNCDFSSTTVWADHSPEFRFSSSRPPGRSFFCEGSNLTPIAPDSYDLVLSSHNLEHFANPVKALYEWKRVLRPGGWLVLVLPHYKYTFDHRRTPTPVAHMLEDFNYNTPEDDLTHLPEILERHDLSLDPPAGSLEHFRERSLRNFENRCLHHHVFDPANGRELLLATGFEVLSVDTARPYHLCLLARAL